jgi:hypothetical protein
MPIFCRMSLYEPALLVQSARRPSPECAENREFSYVTSVYRFLSLG